MWPRMPWRSVRRPAGVVKRNHRVPAAVPLEDRITPSGPGSTGHFQESGQRLVTQSSHDVKHADLDGDGDLDAIFADSQNFPVPYNPVWLNDRKGDFTDTGQRLTSDLSEALALALGDLVGDGDLDVLVVQNGLTSASMVWLNDGHAGFQPTGQSLSSPYVRSIALGDVDGDGDLDTFLAREGASEIWLNDGHAFFRDSGQRLGGSSSSDVALGDVDGAATPMLSWPTPSTPMGRPTLCG
jgi:FG-GAP-like repeat